MDPSFEMLGRCFFTEDDALIQSYSPAHSIYTQCSVVGIHKPNWGIVPGGPFQMGILELLPFLWRKAFSVTLSGQDIANALWALANMGIKTDVLFPKVCGCFEDLPIHGFSAAWLREEGHEVNEDCLWHILYIYICIYIYIQTKIHTHTEKKIHKINLTLGGFPSEMGIVRRCPG